jgi:hypothetical protein
MIGMIPQWFLYSGTDASDGSEVNPVPSEQRSPQIVEAEKMLLNQSNTRKPLRL